MNKNLVILIIIVVAICTNPAQSQNKIYIFFGPYSCYDCFKKIKVSTDSLLKAQIVDSVIVISRSQNKVLLKKLIKRDVSKLFPDYSVKFEYIGEDDPWPPKDLKGGLFGKYNVTVTPTILVYKGDKEIFISYETLYKYNFNLSKIFKDKIN